MSMGSWLVVIVLGYLLLVGAFRLANRRQHAVKPSAKRVAPSEEPSMVETLEKLQLVTGVIVEYSDVCVAHPEPVNDISLLPYPKDTLKVIMKAFVLNDPENAALHQVGYLRLSTFMNIAEKDRESINLMNCVLLPGAETMTEEEWASHPEYACAMEVHHKYLEKQKLEEEYLRTELAAYLAS